LSDISSEVFKSIIEWTTHHYLYFKDINKLSEYDNISKYDSNWIRHREDVLKITVFELFNSAQFLHIPKLIETLSYFIAFKYHKLTATIIYNEFFCKKSNNLDFETSERVFYDILKYRTYLSKVLCHQKVLKMYFFNRSKHFFRIYDYDISGYFTNHRVSLKTFILFDNIDLTGFVNISLCPLLNDKVFGQYLSIVLNLNTSFVISLVFSFFCDETNINDFVICGDYFTSVLNNCREINYFCDLNEIFVKHETIELIIKDDKNTKFYFYYKKFSDLNFPLMNVCFDVKERINSFKFKANDYVFLVNFVNVKISLDEPKHILDYVDSVLERNFNCSKIFYSFSLKSLFVSSYLFEDFFKFKRSVSDNLFLQDFSYNIAEIFDLKIYLERKKRHFIEVKRNSTIDLKNIKLKRIHDNKQLYCFVYKKYIPAIKYLLKGYLIKENLDKFMSSLTFFYDVFKNFIFLFVEKSPEKFNNEQLFRLKYKECLNSYFSI